MIKIIVFGKIKREDLLSLKNEYLKRLTRFLKINIIELKETTFEKDNQKIMGYIENNKNETIVLLDENSKTYSTKEFEKQIKKWEENSDLTFIIGRAEGFSKEAKNLSPNKLSLSKMTFTHEMAQVLLIEQIYRIATIRANIPYHKQ